MDCPRCRRATPEGSRYCNSCGLPLATYAPAGEGEVELWRGAPSVRAFVTPIVLWSLWSAGILVAALLTWRPMAGWGAGMLVLGPTVYLACEVVARKMAVRYSLTSRRVFVEEGFLVRRLREMELAHVGEVVLVQTLPQRLADVGDLVLCGSDGARVKLIGIERPGQVRETIRGRTGGAQ